jgi:hypothetical protein
MAEHCECGAAQEDDLVCARCEPGASTIIAALRAKLAAATGDIVASFDGAERVVFVQMPPVETRRYADPSLADLAWDEHQADKRISYEAQLSAKDEEIARLRALLAEGADIVRAFIDADPSLADLEWAEHQGRKP